MDPHISLSLHSYRSPKMGEHISAYKCEITYLHM